MDVLMDSSFDFVCSEVAREPSKGGLYPLAKTAVFRGDYAGGTERLARFTAGRSWGLQWNGTFYLCSDSQCAVLRGLGVKEYKDETRGVVLPEFFV